MKSQVQPIFDQWLTLMEGAFEALSAEEFSQLEDKIRNEITTSRRDRRKKNVTRKS